MAVMALRRDYTSQVCSMARTLEIVGERWTLLIIRDSFFGVRRFSDFLVHLGIPKAVLSERLGSLVDWGVLARELGRGGHDEYVLTEKGVALRPVLRALGDWGDAFCSPDGPVRTYRHHDCGGRLDDIDQCETCGRRVAPADILLEPGAGLSTDATDPVSAALRSPHRLLTPLETGSRARVS